MNLNKYTDYQRHGMRISDNEHILDTPVEQLDPTARHRYRLITVEQGHDEAERAKFLLQLGLATDGDIRPDLIPASDRDGYLRIPCPVCGALVGDRCSTLTNRNPTDPHTARVDQWYGASA